MMNTPNPAGLEICGCMSGAMDAEICGCMAGAMDASV
jgi:hypothetical protein